ncbi:HECT-type E3 ubiquitin transferase [Aphelenchoides besseyi]|nr:HECT-type E3 ubiquitin transferase [Aphelenchoides besseyi]
MDGVDPETLLEWLQTGAGLERDLQLMALEQLCMLLLMSDNIDRCFESCPPRTFIPALCQIFLDETAPENVLEVTARAITYYLDVSNECTRRITQVEGAVKAICNRLSTAEMADRTSKDLAEQCVKLLEHVCQRECPAVYEAGGLQAMLMLVRQNGQLVHKDTLHSAMAVIQRLCSRVEPQDATVRECTIGLGDLLAHEDQRVSESALRSFAALTDRYIRKSIDPSELAESSNLIEHLLNSLLPDSSADQTETSNNKPSSFVSIVLSLLSNLCRGSSRVTTTVVSSPKLVSALKSALTNKDERCVLDSLRLADLLVILLCEGRGAFTKSNVALVGSDSSPNSFSYDRAHRYLIDVIRQRDTDALIDAVENGSVDPNFTDDVGQTLLNWCAAFGTIDMVQYLCDKGADVNRGQRSSSLHYAACFGRSDVLIALLQNGANPDLRDEDGRTALDKARERADEGHQQVVQILESPSEYMMSPKKKRNNTETTGDGNEKRAESEEPINPIEPTVVRTVIQQLIPVFCLVFTDSMAQSVCRATLSLINKCIKYCPTDAFEELVNGKACKGNSDETDEESSSNFVERLMKVVVTVFNEETNVEGHEQVIMILKSLFTKNHDFWLEQLIRLGIVEKVEQLAMQVGETDNVVVTSNPEEATNALTESLDIFAQEPMDTTESAMDDTPAISNAPSTLTDGSKTSALATNERSTTSTPSIGLRSESQASRETPQPTANEFNEHRHQMLNIPVQFEDIMVSDTPPPTMEELDYAHGQSVSNSNAVETSNALTPRAAERSTSKESSEERNSTEQSASTDKTEPPTDVWALQVANVFKWRDWRLMRDEDTLFVWCDAVALELNDASNGWFRFYLDGRLHTVTLVSDYLIYSSGPAEAGPDNAETRGEFVRKFQNLRTQAGGNGATPKPIFTQPDPRQIESGNWRLLCTKADELVLINVENGGEKASETLTSGPSTASSSTSAGTSSETANIQRIIIKEDLPGFLFEASKFSTRKFVAEMTLGCAFVTGWSARGGDRRLKFRAEAQRQKIQELAKELWESHLKDARNKPRDVFVELRHVSEELQKCVNDCSKNQENFDLMPALKEKFTRVRDLIVNERLLSTFELASSGVVAVLLDLVHEARIAQNGVIYEAFYQVFEDEGILSSMIRRIVEVLEYVEKFDPILYDSGGAAFGLQLLTRRLRFSMQLSDAAVGNQNELLNRTGRILRTEPLATVGQMRTFLHRMVSKMWYDYPRESQLFVRELKLHADNGKTIEFCYESDFDTNGLIWYLGTNARSTSEWVNPAAVGVVSIWCSDGQRMPYGTVEDVLSRDINPMNCHSSDSKDASITIDLGVHIKPWAYTLRHSRGYAKSALRTWDFEGSMDNKNYTLLSRHENDTSLNEVGSTATFYIDGNLQDKPVRYVRIQQRGVNSSNITHFISVSGFEIYGECVDVVTEPFKSIDSTTRSTSGSAPISCFGKTKLSAHAIPTRAMLNQMQREKESKSKKSNQLGSGSSKSSGLRPQRKSGASSSRFVSTEDSQQSDSSTGTDNRSGDLSTRELVISRRNRPFRGTPIISSGINPVAVPTSQSTALNPSTVASALAQSMLQQGVTTAAAKIGSTSQQKSQSTTNLQDIHLPPRTTVAATEQASSATEISSIRQRQSSSLENLLSRARLFPGSVTVPEHGGESGETSTQTLDSIAEVSAIIDSEDQREGTPSIVNETAESVGQQRGQLSTSTPELMAGNHDNELVVEMPTENEETDNQMNDSEFENMDDEQQGQSERFPTTTIADSNTSIITTSRGDQNTNSNHGLVTMYNEMLRVGQIDSIEDIGQFERVILQHEGILDEISDELEDDAETTDDDALHERRRNYHMTHDRALVDELAFIDGRETGIHFESADALAAALNEEEMNAGSLSTGNSSNSERHHTSEFVRILTQAAAARREIRREIRQGAGSNDQSGNSSVGALLNHELVLSMLNSAGYTTSDIPIGGSSNRNTAASLVAISSSGSSAVANTGGRNTRRPTRSWDDEFVLRRQFSALIPAFDPRPGRNNVNQTQDIDLPANESSNSSAVQSPIPSAPLTLRLTSSGLSGTTTTVQLEDDNETIFSAVQRLFNRSAMGLKLTDRARKVWEQTYTIVYENPTEMQSSSVEQIDDETSDDLDAPKNALVRQCLDVLRQLYHLAGDRASDVSFISTKLTQKLQQELGDPLVVASGAFPKWAQLLIYNFPCLFSLDTRSSFLRATAFGTSRAIVWLQTRRDQLLEEARNSGAGSVPSMVGVRREDYPEFRIGRIKHERIKVHRSDELLFENAIRVMKFHASRKAVLEIEYLGEEGTGLGPTLEFYALVAAEFQRKSLAMFLCDDTDEQQQRLEADALDLGEGTKPPGYYVRRAGGLFPAPAPQGSTEAKRIADMFHILGIFLAKVLQDGRLVDLPLSLAFLRLLTSDSVAGSSEYDVNEVCLDGLLGLNDLNEINEHKAKFLRSVQQICIEKLRIRSNSQLTPEQKQREMSELRLQFNGGSAAHECRIEDLGLTFVINPPSTVFNYEEHELIPNGSNVDVTVDNVELYLGKCVDFYLNSGIRQQVAAFREGFDSVFPLRSLKMLTPHEVQKLLSGEQYPEWSRDDLINFTEPKLGYSRDSPGFLRFVDVVAAMTPSERKAFLQFTTGCSSLPPGGLANLHPRLTIVRKVDSGGDGSFPSVNTCVHYLKLPEYSSAEILRERLLAATHEKGFHLN